MAMDAIKPFLMQLLLLLADSETLNKIRVKAHEPIVLFQIRQIPNYISI